MNENELSQAIVESATEVHGILGGPGLLESVYEESLVEELRFGLVINFGQRLVKDGAHRVVNGL
jgi:hypothetical protein